MMNMSNSAPEDQIDTLMMMQMDELSHFFGGYNNNVIPVTPQSPAMSYYQQDYNNIITTNETQPQYTEISPSMNMYLPNSANISLTAGSSLPVQEPNELPLFSLPNMEMCWQNEEDETPNVAEMQNSGDDMREMIFRIAMMKPIHHIDPESVKPPKRRNIKVSNQPSSVSARHRRGRIIENLRTLQLLVPGATRMDTPSMLDEAIHYIKFLKKEFEILERLPPNSPGMWFDPDVPMSSGISIPMQELGDQPSAEQNVPHYFDA